MHTTGPRLETKRLILRPWRRADFEGYAEMFAAPERRRIGGPVLRSDTWRRFLQMRGAWAIQGASMMFTMEDKAGGRLLGQAGPWRSDGGPGSEVGYAPHPGAWGGGHATEACVVAMDYAFDVIGRGEVIHSTSPENTPSHHVTKRPGATSRGPGVRPAPLDAHVIETGGQMRDEWRARRTGIPA